MPKTQLHLKTSHKMKNRQSDSRPTTTVQLNPWPMPKSDKELRA